MLISILKPVASIIVSASAGAVVGNAIKASTPDTVSTASKVLIGIGGVVLSSMVGDMAAKYSSDQIEDVAAQLETLNKIDNAID